MVRIQANAHHAHEGTTTGCAPHPPRPTTSLKTPAHLFTYVGPSQGGQFSGKTYVPKPPKIRNRKRIIYTAPPMGGFIPAKRGAKAQYEIAYFQQTTGPVLPFLPFERLVREILQDITRESGEETFRIAPNAILALRIAAEAHIIQIMRVSSLLTVHGKRLTLQARDMQLCRRLMEDYGLDV